MATYNFSFNFPNPSNNIQNNPQIIPQVTAIPIGRTRQQRVPIFPVNPQPQRATDEFNSTSTSNSNSNSTNRRINFSNGENLSGMIEILSYNPTSNLNSSSSSNNPFNIEQFTNNIINSLGSNSNSNSQRRNRGLSLSELTQNTQLIQVENTTGNQDICNICREPLHGQSNHFVLRKLNNCGHIFHQSCIDMWFEENNHCPNCRTPVVATAQTQTQTHSSVLTDNEIQV